MYYMYTHVAGMNYIPACELACERVPNQKVQRSTYYLLFQINKYAYHFNFLICNVHVCILSAGVPFLILFTFDFCILKMYLKICMSYGYVLSAACIYVKLHVKSCMLWFNVFNLYVCIYTCTHVHTC